MTRKNSPSDHLREPFVRMLDRLMRRNSRLRQRSLRGLIASRVEPLEQRLLLSGVPAGKIFLSENGSAGVVGEFTTAGAVVQSKLASGLGIPTGIAAVGSELFVTSLSNTVSEYTTAGTSEGAVIHGLNDPEGITASGLLLFVSNFGSNTIGEYSTSGNPVETSLVTGLDEPYGLTVSGNDLYVANLAADTVGEYNATTGVAIKTALVTGLNGPTGVAVVGNDLFVENDTGGTIGEYNAATGAAIKTTLISHLAEPHAIVALDGFLFIATGNSHAIAEYTTAGVLVHAALGSGVEGATGIAVDLNPMLTASVHSLALPATAQGTPGVAGSFTLSGVGLTADTAVELTAPTGAEISLTDNIADFAPTLMLSTDGNGSLANTTVYVDIAASASANVSGNLTVDDSADGLGQNIALTGTANAPINPPTIGSLTGDGPVITGASLTLTADDVTTIAPATVKTVDFYFDTPGTGIFNPAKDKLLGVGKRVSGTSNYTLTAATTSLPVGADGFFARAVDSKGHDSAPVSATFNITPAAPAKLVFTTEPVGTTAGSTLADVVVKIEDVHGNVETSDDSAVTLSIPAGGPGPFDDSSTVTVDAVNGVATFSSVALDTTGTYTLAAADVTDNLANFKSAAFKITPGALASLAFVQQPPSSLVAGKIISPGVSVIAKDAFGNILSGSTVTLSVSSGLSGALLGTLSVKTSATGIATFSGLSVHAAATYTLAAHSASITSDPSDSLDVTPAKAVKMIFSVQPPASSPTLSSFGVTVELLDTYGNPSTSAEASTITLTLALSPHGTSLGGTLTNSVSNGLATFGGLTLATPGSYKLKAVDTSISLDAISAAFTVTT